jgi:hypothetical protein
VPSKNRRPALTKTALRGALTFFHGLRLRRGGLTLAQLRALRRLLAETADALYRLADRVERGERVQVPRNLFDELADRAERVGAAHDPVLSPALAAISELRRQHRTRVLARRPPTARELRSAAIRLMGLADVVEDARDALDVPHRPSRPAVGRPRNRILDRILEYTTRHGVRDAELARALADVGFVPDGPGSSEVDVAERWAAIIKSARARRRRAAGASSRVRRRRAARARPR